MLPLTNAGVLQLLGAGMLRLTGCAAGFLLFPSQLLGRQRHPHLRRSPDLQTCPWCPSLRPAPGEEGGAHAAPVPLPGGGRELAGRPPAQLLRQRLVPSQPVLAGDPAPCGAAGNASSQLRKHQRPGGLSWRRHGAGTLRVAAQSLSFKPSPFLCWGERRVGKEGKRSDRLSERSVRGCRGCGSRGRCVRSVGANWHV